MMTPTAGGPGEHETLSKAVARRLRGRMGELQLKGTEVAAAIGMTQGSFSRRYTGTAAWELDELELLESATGIRITYLLGLEDAAGESTITGVISRIEPAAEQQPPRQGPPPAPSGPPQLQYLDPSPIRYDHDLWPGSPAVRQAIA
jgi:hypothetical protein